MHPFLIRTSYKMYYYEPDCNLSIYDALTSELDIAEQIRPLNRE